MNTHTVEDQISASPDAPISLIEAITALLVDAHHPQPSFWLSGLHPDAFVTTDQNIQRFLINRQWRNIINAVPVTVLDPHESLDVRYYLVDQGEIKDWLRLFKEGVLPCVMKHQLPLAN